mgnify:FL=1
MEHFVKILKIESLTPNIKRFVIEKPKNYKFVSGQHALISINKIKLKDNIEVINKKRPFSFSSSEKDDFLEFIIKIYPERNGITKEFDKLKPKDELIIGEPKGKMSYQGNGTFIAAGTGINPFISIIKSLDENERENNFLIYSNKTKDQIILEKELKEMFKDNLILTLTQEKIKGYENKRVDKDFLKKNIKNFAQKFYICGPFKMVRELKQALIELGAKEENVIS